MTTLAVIPARGGSKGIPRKNLVDLGGKPLLHWTIEAAHRSGVIDHLVVSSDSQEILACAAEAGSGTHDRPLALAADDVHSVHVVHDVVAHESDEGRRPEIVVMLLPTSPFRRPEHIIEAVAVLQTSRPPAVVSVVEHDKQMIHLRHLSAEGELEPLLPWNQLTAQRQDQPRLYALNGSIYVARAEELRRAGTFHVPGAMAIVMGRTASIDINEPSDLEWARYVLANEGAPW